MHGFFSIPPTLWWTLPSQTGKIIRLHNENIHTFRRMNVCHITWPYFSSDMSIVPHRVRYDLCGVGTGARGTIGKYDIGHAGMLSRNDYCVTLNNAWIVGFREAARLPDNLADISSRKGYQVIHSRRSINILWVSISLQILHAIFAT